MPGNRRRGIEQSPISTLACGHVFRVGFPGECPTVGSGASSGGRLGGSRAGLPPGEAGEKPRGSPRPKPDRGPARPSHPTGRHRPGNWSTAARRVGDGRTRAGHGGTRRRARSGRATDRVVCRRSSGNRTRPSPWSKRIPGIFTGSRRCSKSTSDRSDLRRLTSLSTDRLFDTPYHYWTAVHRDRGRATGTACLDRGASVRVGWRGE